MMLFVREVTVIDLCAASVPAINGTALSNEAVNSACLTCLELCNVRL